MKMNFIRRSIFILVFIPASSIFALELKSDDLNYIVTIPGTWTIKSQDSTGFYIKSQDGKEREMFLAIVPAPFARLDSSYIAKFEQVLKNTRSLQLVSSRVFTIDGVPAYENIQRLGKPIVVSVQVEHQIIADGKFYGLTTEVIGGDATQDSELQEGLASFHFLHPPKISAGRFGFLGVKLTVVGIIMAGIVFWFVRSRKTEI
jgi:hypothetical protein